MIKRLLIANRGEIACRVIRTAQQQGIHCIAVYSDADKNALFVKMADEAWHIGAAEPSKSYLDVQKILRVAKDSRADAIHPGYGFLSENAIFAEQCEQTNIKFIGPSADVIRKMGSKSASKKIMEAAAVPLTPGYHGDDQSTDRFVKEAKSIGYPILVKASAGGGGKGMRVVESESDMVSAIEAAKREAKNAFNDEHLLLEKYIIQPRHVEVQVFCDQHQNALYLNDRDCSVQRRHQKVIEEAPAPNLSDATREAMGKAAVACALQIGYEGAGTVEFLVDHEQNFYFMEMNTRLQVEHPVTEMITGLDLVAWQISVANGEPLPITQDQVACHGHAMEARIYAEDPANDFLPDAGKLHFLRQPAEQLDSSSKVRIDSGVTQGDEISIYYDPMIAKLIVWAPTRPLACQKLAQQLRQYAIDGIHTNTGFLHRLVDHPDFIQEKLNTAFINEHPELLTKPAPDEAILAAVCMLYLQPLPAENQDTWTSVPYWRSVSNYQEKLVLAHHQEEICILANHQQGNTWQLVSEKVFAETLEASAHIDIETQQIKIYVGNAQHHFQYSWRHPIPDASSYNRPNGVTIFHHGEAYVFDFPANNLDAEHNDAAEAVIAPMHGKIIALLAQENQRVERGQPLMILEAMKMEHSINAPADGLVNAFLCREGDNVESDQILVDFTADSSTEGEE